MEASEFLKLTFASRDEFVRRPAALMVAKLLTSDIDISPMLLAGPWGSGKSEFCIKLCNLFREEHKDYRVAYIDAFQSDHSDEPLVTILGALSQLLPDDTENRGKFIKNAAPVARVLVKTFGKALVGHLLKENAEKLEEDMQEAVSDAGEKAVEGAADRLIRYHAEIPDNIKSLRACLEGLAREKPIILFIDELDRCRPDFAVELLESIKHIFDVPGVQFFLVANFEKLKSSIAHRYGERMDTELYLDKFFKYRFAISENMVSGTGDSIPNSRIMFDLLTRYYGFYEDPEGCLEVGRAQGLYEYMRCLALNNACSLRDVEKLVRCMRVFDVARGPISSVNNMLSTMIEDYRERVAQFDSAAIRKEGEKNYCIGMVEALTIFFFIVNRSVIENDYFNGSIKEIIDVVQRVGTLSDYFQAEMRNEGLRDILVQKLKVSDGTVVYTRAREKDRDFLLSSKEVDTVINETIQTLSLI